MAQGIFRLLSRRRGPRNTRNQSDKTKWDRVISRLERVDQQAQKKLIMAKLVFESSKKRESVFRFCINNHFLPPSSIRKCLLLLLPAAKLEKIHYSGLFARMIVVHFRPSLSFSGRCKVFPRKLWIIFSFHPRREKQGFIYEAVFRSSCIRECNRRGLFSREEINEIGDTELEKILFLQISRTKN